MNGIAQAGSGQILGRRDEQQDALGFGTVALADGRRAPLAVLADGMGGHHGGAIAARLAIETFLGACQASPARTFTGALEAALLDVNRALAARSREDARLDQMGCTLIATAVEGGVLHYVSVGDSLLWRIGVDRIERLNADHSMLPLVTAALAQGKMTQAEAQAHGSILRSAVTGRPIELIDLRTVELARDEWVLLASDGILSLPEPVVHGFVRPTGATAQTRVDALLDAVEQAGEPEQDNCTIVLLAMTAAPAKGARRPLATVLGTLAIIAGLGVVGAAGWELLRQNRPHLSGTAVRAKVPPATPPSKACATPVAKPPAPRPSASAAKTEATRSRRSDRQGQNSKLPGKTIEGGPVPPSPGSPKPSPSPSTAVGLAKQGAASATDAANGPKPVPPPTPDKPTLNTSKQKKKKS